jgi:hypothetical protein
VEEVVEPVVPVAAAAGTEPELAVERGKKEEEGGEEPAGKKEKGESK